MLRENGIQLAAGAVPESRGDFLEQSLVFFHTEAATMDKVKLT